MSRTITVSDELYKRLDAETRARGLKSIERLPEEWGQNEDIVKERKDAVKEIDDLRERLFDKYTAQPDSVELVRADRAR
jgi:predicted CopG family antitoxin